MRPIIIFLAVAGVAIITWLIVDRPGEKPTNTKAKAIDMAQHSSQFNDPISILIADYNKMAENFVNWDSATAMQSATTISKDLDNIKLDELKKDSNLYVTAQTSLENAKGDLQTIQTEKTIQPQRQAFNSLTGNLYQFLNAVKYDKEKLYLQECPMAFGDNAPGQWLSPKEDIRNPYLGLHHPTYGHAMISCGETKETIDHTEGK